MMTWSRLKRIPVPGGFGISLDTLTGNWKKKGSEFAEAFHDLLDVIEGQRVDILAGMDDH